MPINMLKHYPGTLVGFSDKRVEVCGYINLQTKFGGCAKTIILIFMVIRTTSSYNIIMGRPTLNGLMVVVSYRHMCIKYPLSNGKVSVVRGDQVSTHKCYAESVKVKVVQKKEGKKPQLQFLGLRSKTI